MNKGLCTTDEYCGIMRKISRAGKLLKEIYETLEIKKERTVMKRIRKLTTAFLVIALLVTSLVSVPAFADDTSTTVTRIGGDNRYLTAIEVSKEAYKNEADVVIIASGEEWPDALAGSALAAVKKAPILLAKKDMIHDYTIEEIERLGAKKAIILGGPEAIGAPVEDALKAMDGLTVYRIGGSNRFETATLIAGQLGNDPTVVYLASSEDYADALAIGPLAYVNEAPVLLTKADKLNATTKAYLASLDSVTVTIVGGVDAISKAVEDEVKDIEGVSAVDRLAGENRWETSVKIAEKFTDPTQIVVALGNNFPDALVGGYYAGSIEAPIVLVKGDSISGSVDGFVWASGRQSYHKWIIGGKDAIKPVVETDLKNIGKILAGFTVEATTKWVKAQTGEQQLKYTINGRDPALYTSTPSATFLYNKVGMGNNEGALASDIPLKTPDDKVTTFKYQVKVTVGEGASALTGQSAMQEVTVYRADEAVSVEVTLLPDGPIYLSTVGPESAVKFSFVAKNAADGEATVPAVDGTPTTTGKAKAEKKIADEATSWILTASEAGKSKITFKFEGGLTADIDVEVLADPVATTVETTDAYKAKVVVDATTDYDFAGKFDFFDQYGKKMDAPGGSTYGLFNANDAAVTKLGVAGKYTIKIWNGAGKLIASFPVEAIDTTDAKPDEIKIVFDDVDGEEFENTLKIGDKVSFEIKAFYDGFELEGTVAGYEVFSSDDKVVNVVDSNINGLKHGTATIRLVKMEGDFEGDTVYTVDIVVADPQVTAINFVAPYDKVYFTGTVAAADVAVCTDVLAGYIESVQFVAATKVVVVKIKAANGGQVFTLPAVDHAFLNGTP